MGVRDRAVRICAMTMIGAGLAACQIDGANLAPMPDYVTQAVYDEAVAHFIAQRCPSVGQVKQTRATNYVAVYNKMQTDGHTREDFERWRRNFPEAELEKRASDYFVSRGVTSMSDPGICRVGLEEIAANSMIGRHLRVEE